LLLKSPNYTAVLPDVVRLLGEAVGSDRCAIVNAQSYPLLIQSPIAFAAEWCGENVPYAADSTPDVVSMSWQDFPELYECLLLEKTANYFVMDLSEPNRSLFVRQGISSIVYLPIIVNGQPWGQIGFDNCGQSRLFDEAEIAILKVAADSIAAAIARQQKDEALQKSEALYRSLFEISNEGIYRVEYDSPISLNAPIVEQVEQVYRSFRVVQANDAFAKMYGLTRGEEMLGVKLTELHVEDSEKNLEFIRSTVENNYQIRNMESEEIGVDGQPRYFLNSIIGFVEGDRTTGGWATQIDITELRQAQQALLQAEQNRAILLTTVTTVANQLLRAADYTTVIPNVLQLLGEVAQADRCGLVRNVTDSHGQPAAQIQSEWCRENIQLSIVHTPDLETAFPWDLFPDGYAKLSQGETLEFRVDQLAEPARSILQEQGNISMLMVPIVVQDEFWGVFGFDYCQEERSLDPNTTGIFAIAVDSIAAAIERQQKAEAALQAEQAQVQQLAASNQVLQRREQWLESTAAAANALLSSLDLDDSINTALRLLGEGIEVDRVEVMQSFDPVDDTSLGFVRTLYEWDSPGTSSQINHPEYQDISWEGMEDWFAEVQTGNWIGGVVEELPEPFRSGQIELGIQSTYAVPIFAEGHFWGILAIDCCREPKKLTPSEISVFKTAACIGSAIERDRLQEERESLIVQERTRMAREIHDTLAQAFGGILTQLQAAQYFFPTQPDKAHYHLNRARGLTQTGLTAARRSVWSLSQEGSEFCHLATLIPKTLQQLTANHTIQTQYETQGTAYPVEPEIGMNLLRILQEAIANTLRHAAANTLKVTLNYNVEGITLQICDDGRGFDLDQNHPGFGLTGIRQRADHLGATLHISSHPYQGTTVQIHQPIHPTS
jgi:PAS domain S-box-containing protein